jgi:hypothetical protein
MSFRVSALVAGVVVLGLSSVAPVSAQPQAPVRPRYSTFGNIFSPQQRFGNGGAFGQNAPFVNPLGPQVAGVPAAQGFVYPGQTSYSQVLPGVFATDPQLPPTGVVGTFNNLGHWYGSGTGGGYGHWYPNGITNGRGILGYGGGGGYAGGMAAGPTGSRGSLMGAGVGVGATVGALRR